MRAPRKKAPDAAVKKLTTSERAWLQTPMSSLEDFLWSQKISDLKRLCLIFSLDNNASARITTRDQAVLRLYEFLAAKGDSSSDKEEEPAASAGRETKTPPAASEVGGVPRSACTTTEHRFFVSLLGAHDHVPGPHFILCSPVLNSRPIS
jgi:hypothetical protein